MVSLSENDLSDVCSSDGTDENDDVASSYTSRSTALCEADPDYALSLGRENRGWDFSKVDKLTFENCLEGHVGTKIVTENVNIIVGKGKSAEIGTIFDDKFKVQYSKDRSLDLSNDGNKLPVKSLNYWAIGGFSLLVIGVFASLMTFAVEDEQIDRSTDLPTKDPEPVTNEFSTKLYPITIDPENGVDIVSRSEWGGVSPSKNNYIPSTIFQYIALDNLRGNHCSTVTDCSLMLKQAEKDSGEPLNFNFLMDDSGTLYEARGWNYKCNEESASCHFSTTLKLGFIGNYSTEQLTQLQKSVLLKFLKNAIHIAQGIIEIKSLCCCAITGANDPSKNIICDAKSAVPLLIGFVNNKCTNCPTTC